MAPSRAFSESRTESEHSRRADDVFTNMATEKRETSVPLYSVSSQQNSEDSYNSNRPTSVQDEFMFRSSSPESNAEYSGNIDTSRPSGIDDANSNAYNLSSIFNKKKFAWLLEVDDGGDDEDMDKPLL